MFFVGDFNGHSQQWWQVGDSAPEGNSIEDLTAMLGLTQLTNEPTNFEPNKNPSCIYLAFTYVLGPLLSPPNNSMSFQL